MIDFIQARKRKECSTTAKSVLHNEKKQIFEEDEFADIMEEIEENIDMIFE